MRRWVVSGIDKIPQQIDGKNAAIDNPDTWEFFSKIQAVVSQDKALLPVVVVQHQLLCLDLDNCLDSEGKLSSLAQEILNTIVSYAEISRGGRGLHIFFLGKKPGHSCRAPGLEFYGGENAHFITVTGAVYANRSELRFVPQEIIDAFYFEYFPQKEKSVDTDCPKSPSMPDEEIIRLCRIAKNGEAFIALFEHGDLRAYHDDHSAADAALCAFLAFFSQNIDQIDRLFQRSALHKDERRKQKWSRPDYKSNTITRAIRLHKDFFQPKRELGANPRKGTWEQPVWPEVGGDPVDELFPCHCLPQIVQRAVQEVARDVRVDPAMAAVSAIGTLSLVTGKKVTVIEKEGLEHHPSLFLLCIALPVERKSESYKRILDPLRDLLETDISEWEIKRRRIIAHNESVQEQIGAVKSKIRETAKQPGESKKLLEDLRERLAALHGEIREIPAHPKNWIDDSTPEKLKKNLYQHKGEFGLFSAEGRTILHTIQNPDGQNATAKSLYTCATWGDALDRDRVTGGEAGEGERWELRHPALTIVAFVQPDAWKSFSEDPIMRGNGTLSRICVARPRSLVGSRMESEEEPPYNVGEVLPFVTLLDRIRKWRPEQTLRVPLSKEAARARRLFFNAWEAEIGPGGTYEDVADLVGRSASITSRLSLLLAVARSAEKNSLGQPLEITVEDWLNAQEIEEWFMTNGIDSLRSQSRSHEDCESRVFTWLGKEFHSGGKEFLASTLRNRCRLTKEETTQVISSFETRGVIKVGRKSRGKSFYYDINPQIPEVQEDAAN